MAVLSCGTGTGIKGHLAKTGPLYKGPTAMSRIRDSIVPDMLDSLQNHSTLIFLLSDIIKYDLL